MSELRQRQPRSVNKKHKDFIAQCQCVICGAEPVEVAHVRYASYMDDARNMGRAEKPDDARTVPICPTHHRLGDDAQHGSGEADWWRQHNINPYALAKALYALSGDLTGMRSAVRKARSLFPPRS